MSEVKDNKQKVYVGLSGGVDSSVSAALLQDAGHDVTGVFIRAWYPDFIECDWKKERRDAMRVCAHLNIPFKEFDLSRVYKREVVDYMIAEYQQGRTPNPDVMCNRYVKFGAFLDWARKEGADFVATGHYARLRLEGKSKNEKVKIKLLKGVDNSKDQSYFLWTLSQNELEHILFPVGHLQKSEVRRIAEEKGLLTAAKKDSQGLCFIGHVDMKEFLSHYIDLKRGNLLNQDGEVIGYHEGSELYTIGERHGFTVTKKTPSDDPYYVVSKDVEKNTVTVSHARPGEVSIRNATVIQIGKINWISGEPEEEKIEARIRYRQPLQACELVHDAVGVNVRFADPQQAVALGQSCVFYHRETCLGGGIVEKIVS